MWSYFILRVLPCALQVCEIVLHLEEQLTDYYEIETICYITYRVFFSEGKDSRQKCDWMGLPMPLNEFQAFNQIRLSGEHIYWFVENPGHSTRMIFIYTDS